MLPHEQPDRVQIAIDDGDALHEGERIWCQGNHISN